MSEESSTEVSEERRHGVNGLIIDAEMILRELFIKSFVPESFFESAISVGA